MARKTKRGPYTESEVLEDGTIVLRHYEHEPRKETDEEGRVITFDTVRGVRVIERDGVRLPLPLRQPPEPPLLPAGELPAEDGAGAVCHDPQAAEDAEAADAAAWEAAEAKNRGHVVGSLLSKHKEPMLDVIRPIVRRNPHATPDEVWEELKRGHDRWPFWHEERDELVTYRSDRDDHLDAGLYWYGRKATGGGDDTRRLLHVSDHDGKAHPADRKRPERPGVGMRTLAGYITEIRKHLEQTSAAS